MKIFGYRLGFFQHHTAKSDQQKAHLDPSTRTFNSIKGKIIAFYKAYKKRINHQNTEEVMGYDEAYRKLYAYVNEQEKEKKLRKKKKLKVELVAINIGSKVNEKPKITKIQVDTSNETGVVERNSAPRKEFKKVLEGYFGDLAVTQSIMTD